LLPQPLNRPFIGILLLKHDYEKVKGMLPTPTYKSLSYSHCKTKIELVFVLHGYISSYRQYFWLSNVKLALKEKLFISFDFIEEYSLIGNEECSNCVYSFDELSKAFGDKQVKYTLNAWNPSTNKELYTRLILHGKKLRYRKVLTKEALTGIALYMNRRLKDKLSIREVHKKALASYKYIHENIDNFPQSLEKRELKEAQRKGAKATNSKQSEKTKDRIMNELRGNNSYIKPNGDVNKTSLSRALNLNRRTIERYL